MVDAATAAGRRTQERETLRNVIAQWNANRLDLFELSEPNEDLEFHGVMRFYFQDAGQKVATKCIRVASSATTTTVIETLIEKFRPDLRMLSIPEYALYEIHESGDERKLGEGEKPLLVQLNWHKDDREGRFLLRRMDEKTFVTHQSLEDGTHFKRKLSKREKKEKKKREKILKAKTIEEEEEDKDGIAEKLYTEMPETSFTRSISNPEAVMRRRRQQKLEKKLQQFRSKDGGPDTGGTLKIYGESLCKDVPYKTLLLSVRDNAAFVVKEMLDKYGLDREDPANYCLVQVLVDSDRESRDYPNNNGVPKEVILDDDECPLAILMNYHPSRGSPIFHIQKRPGDYQPRKRKKKPKSAKGGDPDGLHFGDGSSERIEPFFQELNPDGSDVTSCAPKRYALGPNVTEVGSERGVSTNVQHLQLFGPNVYPRHCVVAHTDGIVTVTPCNRDAETFVNWQRIHETTILQHGMTVRFGKIHCFRFLDPAANERRQRHDSVGRHQGDVSYDKHSTKDDTSLHHSFENDGNVETVSTSSLKEDLHSERGGKENRVPHNALEMQHRGHDPILPAILELYDGEDPFLTSTISGLDTAAVQFKLAPTYTLYMASRFRASTHYRPEIAPTERAHRLTVTLTKVANKIQAVIQDRCLEAGSLAFWMANSSELLHFLKQDRHLSPFCVDAQDILAECVQIAFRNLVNCMQNELLNAMPAFLEDRDDLGEEEGTSGEILSVLSSAMALLRRCRVNAALTIQLFSQLFHFVNMWLFNRVVCEPRPTMCTRLWGARLKCRLARIEMWAEKQGLELAADCHLSRILQAADLLQAPKSTSDDLAAISSTCFKLNSLQLRSLLERYQMAPDEPNIPPLLIENVIKVAESTADEMTRSDGRDVRLEEDPDLQLPFLLPEDGYSSDIVRGVPAGLQEFVSPFQRAGLCRLTIQPSSSGFWTIYMTEHEPQHNNHGPRSPSVQSHPAEPARVLGSSPEPEVATIKLQKSNNGMGLSIVAARGVGQEKLGIYIKSVVSGGAADLDGRLQAGDQLLKVDGQSLVGISQEKAAEYMTRTGPVVHLEVAKEGAIYHGLATLLSQPSPVIHRAGSGYPGMRRLSERDIHSKVLREQNQDSNNVPNQDRGGAINGGPSSVLPRMQSSKSVPSLNSGVGSAPHSEPFWTPLSTNGSRPQHPHESYNPSYSRTSSTTSIMRTGQQDMAANRDQTLRARSTNNLRQHSHPAGIMTSAGQQGAPPRPQYNNNNNESINNGEDGGQIRGRPLSQPNLQQQDEERHYQNISLYQQHQQQQQQQQHASHQQNQHSKPPPVSPQVSHPSVQALPSPTPKGPGAFGQLDDRMSQRMRGSQGSLYRPPDQSQLQQQPQRPVSALLPQWDKDQNWGPMSPTAVSMQWGKAGFDPRYQQQGMPQEGTSNPLNDEALHRSGSDAKVVADHGPEKPRRLPDGTWRNERDLFRQEAKMEEMREEIRRREERVARERKIQELQQQQRWSGNPATVRFEQQQLLQQQQQHPGHIASQAAYPADKAHLMRGPPPTTPKPRFVPVGYAAQPQHRPQYVSQDVPPERPPLPQEELIGHRDSPQPPPPPPSSTHPLYHQQGPTGARWPAPAAYRYGPGGLPLSRSIEHFDRVPPHDAMPMHSRNLAVTNQLNQLATQANHRAEMGANSNSSSSLLLSPSPWEREERERERKRRLDEARRLRDQEIDELEAIQRSAKQEERLRTLRLEKEFQRRADELSRNQNDDDEENEEEDDAIDRRGFLRLVQEDLERARIKRLERENDRIQKQQLQQQDEMRRQDRQFTPHLDPSRPQSMRRDISQQQQQQLQQQQLQQQQAVMTMNSPPNRSEEWLRRQQEIKEQRRELQQQEEQQHVMMRERQQRLDEANRKREQKKEQERLAIRELQNAREAEERILREAQKRKEEEMRRERAMQQHHQQQQLYHHQKNMSMLNMPGAQYVASGHPVDNGHVQGQPPYGSSGAQRLDTLLMSQQQQQQLLQQQQQQQQQQLQYNHTNGGAVTSPPPPPPERKGSYDTMAQIEGHWDGPISSPVSIPAKEGKRVSFHDSKMASAAVTEDESPSPPPPMPPLASSFVTPPSQMQPMSTFTVGSTPGVIGAQEVYRDPRQRIEASRRVDGLGQTLKGPGPEQLSFREKMKKFALETGENNTPRDKVKISKAQREIESNMTNGGVPVPGSALGAPSAAIASVRS